MIVVLLGKRIEKDRGSTPAFHVEVGRVACRRQCRCAFLEPVTDAVEDLQRGLPCTAFRVLRHREVAVEGAVGVAAGSRGGGKAPGALHHAGRLEAAGDRVHSCQVVGHVHAAQHLVRRRGNVEALGIEVEVGQHRRGTRPPEMT